MEGRVKLLGHPVHQMLIPIPAGLFIVAAVLDIVDAFANTTWIPTVTFWNITLGIFSALLAAVFGALDWTKIPRATRAKRIGMIHGIGNFTAVVLFALAVWRRSTLDGRVTDGLSLTLEIISFALLGCTAWLGGELVDRLGVGVDEGANVNAPSSLRTKHVPPSLR